ncbi:hypothetical protein CR513_58863, partial [Mucuna pruriens]
MPSPNWMPTPVRPTPCANSHPSRSVPANRGRLHSGNSSTDVKLSSRLAQAWPATQDIRIHPVSTSFLFIPWSFREHLVNRVSAGIKHVSLRADQNHSNNNIDYHSYRGQMSPSCPKTSSGPLHSNVPLPWKYNMEVKLGNDENHPRTFIVKNIIGTVYSLENLRKKELVKETCRETPLENEVEKAKEKGKKEVSNEEASKFLKFISQSKYELLDQLNHTPAKISLLSLLMNFESHRKLLMKILNEEHVAHDIMLDKFGGLFATILPTITSLSWKKRF